MVMYYKHRLLIYFVTLGISDQFFTDVRHKFNWEIYPGPVGG